MEAHNEEMVPHPFNSRTPYEPGDDRDIWCRDCEYHRDHQIHIGSTGERERDRLRRAAAVIPLASADGARGGRSGGGALMRHWQPDPVNTFMIRHCTSGRYVERRPYDGAWTWLAPWSSYATVFQTKAEADTIAALMEAEEPGCAEILELDARGDLVKATRVVRAEEVA